MNETELLFTEVLSCSRPFLYLNKNKGLDRDKSTAIAAALRRRIRGEPIQYILGKTEFMGLEFAVNEHVFIPRPETEILVEAALKIAGSPGRPQPFKILDIGTGSGCIAVSLAKLLPAALVTATDISTSAINMARDNAALNNVAGRINFIQGDLFTTYSAIGLGGLANLYGENLPLTTYDLIISNPPYIPTSQIAALQPEIAYEPRLALDGGSDGLDFYRRIIAAAPRHLEEKGVLILEIGFGQKPGLKNILQKSGNFGIIEVVKDYSGIDRVIIAGLE